MRYNAPGDPFSYMYYTGKAMPRGLRKVMSKIPTIGQFFKAGLEQDVQDLRSQQWRDYEKMYGVSWHPTKSYRETDYDPSRISYDVSMGANSSWWLGGW